MAQRRCPPVALIECVADIAQRHHKVRRLHLVIVDLWRPWKINQTQVRSLTGALRRLQYSADCTTPLSPQPGKTPLHGRRFVYGYSLDGSDFPCYLLWPVRTPTGSYCLLESQTQQYVDMEHVDYLHPLGLRHFYDGFGLRAEVSIRIPALCCAKDIPDRLVGMLKHGVLITHFRHCRLRVTTILTFTSRAATCKLLSSPTTPDPPTITNTDYIIGNITTISLWCVVVHRLFLVATPPSSYNSCT